MHGKNLDAFVPARNMESRHGDPSVLPLCSPSVFTANHWIRRSHQDLLRFLRLNTILGQKHCTSALNIERRTSDLEHRTLDLGHWTSDTEYQKLTLHNSVVQCPMSDVQWPISDVLCLFLPTVSAGTDAFFLFQGCTTNLASDGA